MAQIYQRPDHTGLVLSNNNSQILLFPKYKEHFGRHKVLCNDYSSDLSSVLYQRTIFYSYLTKTKQIQVKKIGIDAPLFSAPIPTSCSYASPQLFCISNTLLLFTFLQNRDQNTITALCCLPEHHTSFTELPLSIHAASPYSLLCTSNYICIIQEDDLTVSLLDKALKLHFLPKEAAKEASNVKLEQEHLLQQLSAQNKEIQQLTAMLDSATGQYNELMTVATKYKEEATKWRNQFISALKQK